MINLAQFVGLLLWPKTSYEKVNNKFQNLKNHCNGDAEVEGYGATQSRHV